MAFEDIVENGSLADNEQNINAQFSKLFLKPFKIDPFLSPRPFIMYMYLHVRSL